MRRRPLSVLISLRGEHGLPPPDPPLLSRAELGAERFLPLVPPSFPLPFAKSPNTFGIDWMGVHTRPRVFLGAHAVFTPGEADLRFPIFVFALAFAFGIVCKYLGHIGKVIFELYFFVFGAVFAPDELVRELPESLVRPCRI